MPAASDDVGASPSRTPTLSAKKAPTAKPKGGAPILHGSVLVTNLPSDLRSIYSRTIRRFFPKVPHAAIGDVEILEEADNATLVVHVKSKQVAERMCKRLQNAKVNGRRWKAQAVPLKAVECESAACLVECTLCPPASRDLAEHALSTVSGFLALTACPGASEEEEGDARGSLSRALASFADEGSAIHARAVLSGRLVGTSGVRMFLQRRPKEDETK